MVEQDFEKYIHTKLLESLVFFDGVCRKENIKYSLYGGTLIGAIRHKGFIPWDDDIDVAMERAEYDRFKAAVGNYIQDGKYVFSYLEDRVPELNFAEKEVFNNQKLGDIGVDIYIADNLPNDATERKRLIFRLKIVQGMMKKGKLKYWKTYSLKSKILVVATKVLGAGFSLKQLVRKYTELCCAYNDTSTQCKFVGNDVYKVFDVPFEAQLFEDGYEDVPFENVKLMVFKDYDIFLTKQYGDYMTLPPESERHFYHVVGTTK